MEEMIKAWMAASGTQRDFAVRVLKGETPALDPTVYNPEPMVSLSTLAKRMEMHPGTLIKQGVHAIAHGRTGTTHPRYRWSEFEKWWEGRMSETPGGGKELPASAREKLRRGDRPGGRSEGQSATQAEVKIPAAAEQEQERGTSHRFAVRRRRGLKSGVHV